MFTAETQDEGLPRESILVTHLIVFVLVRVDQFGLVFSVRNEQKNMYLHVWLFIIKHLISLREKEDVSNATKLWNAWFDYFAFCSNLYSGNIIYTHFLNVVPVETDKLFLIKSPSQPGASHHSEGTFLIRSVGEKVTFVFEFRLLSYIWWRESLKVYTDPVLLSSCRNLAIDLPDLSTTSRRMTILYREKI